MHHNSFSVPQLDSHFNSAGSVFDNLDLHSLHHYTDEVLQTKEKIAEESEHVCQKKLHQRNYFQPSRG